MAMETGCKVIFLSKLPSNSNLKINKNNTPMSKGSVGRYRFTGISGIK
jgi:hypothetical protein